MFDIKLIFKLDLAVPFSYLIVSGKGVILVFKLSAVWPHRPTAQTKIKATLVDGVSSNLRAQL